MKESHPYIYFVFQGNTFEEESRGGYIWAPIFDSAKRKPHHWERLCDVKEGDIIFHGCGGYIKAVSVAKGRCFDCIQPLEIADRELWDNHGINTFL